MDKMILVTALCGAVLAGCSSNQKIVKNDYAASCETNSQSDSHYRGGGHAQTVASKIVVESSDAINAIEAMARQGEKEAQFNLWQIYSQGVTTEDCKVVNKDYDLALNWLYKAASSGHQFAQYQLGKILEGGVGIKKDEIESLIWYSLASRSKGDRVLAELAYTSILDVVKYEELITAAKKGDVVSQREIASIYHAGFLGNDYEPVHFWYSKAANQGDGYSQFQLGKLYETGKGIDKDLAKALSWYSSAVNHSYDAANEEIERLKREHPALKLDS